MIRSTVHLYYLLLILQPNKSKDLYALRSDIFQCIKWYGSIDNDANRIDVYQNTKRTLHCGREAFTAQSSIKVLGINHVEYQWQVDEEP